MKMFRFEIKKVFSKTKNQIAIAVLFVIVIVTGVMTINRVEYTDENGNHSTGIAAARNLREAKNEWAGYLTEDVFRKVIEENNRINNSEEALSDDIEEQNKAYAKKQGMLGIIDVLSQAFSEYDDYDYYAADRVSPEDAGKVYENRIAALKKYLDSDEVYCTEKQREFMIRQYENLETPFYYEYIDGWSALLQNVSTFLLMLALVIGFLVSGIFSDEFQVKADSVFFSTRWGRSRGTMAKLGAGFCIISVFYVLFAALYTGIVLFVLGADGAGCPVQLELWDSVYNITLLQTYLFILLGGYVGTVFASTVAMLVSAVTRSTPTAIVMPFILLCAFPFLSRIINLPQICSYFPDQLLEVYLDVKGSALAEIGGKVMPIATVIIPAYALVSLIFQPILYKVYQKTEIK